MGSQHPYSLPLYLEAERLGLGLGLVMKNALVMVTFLVKILYVCSDYCFGHYSDIEMLIRNLFC